MTDSFIRTGNLNRAIPCSKTRRSWRGSPGPAASPDRISPVPVQASNPATFTTGPRSAGHHSRSRCRCRLKSQITRKEGSGEGASTADKTKIVLVDRIERLIQTVRGQNVILDGDLAALYWVPTKRLNEQVRCNRERFPEDFVFQLTGDEAAALSSQPIA